MAAASADEDRRGHSREVAVQDIVSAAAVAALLIACAVVFAKLRQGRAAGDERGLPRELVGAEIAYAEHTFRSARHRLVAKIDRAYRVGGELKLMELKTRARDLVYMSDVLELSVQRIAVQDETGEPVCPDAWVIVQNSNTARRRPHSVELFGREEISVMAQRFRELSAGRVDAPCPAKSPAQCRHCAHRQRCSAKFNDR
jgi:hypothetical protein